MKVEWVPATQLLRLQRRSVEIEPDTTYQEIGVRSFGRGLFLKDPVSGVEIGSKRVFEIHEGDFVVSNVFAWEGAVGIADAEHHGRIGSHRFMTWTPVSEVKVNYLVEFFRSSRGVAALAAASPGSAGRNRTLSIANFEAIRVPLPSDADQERIAAYLAGFATYREQGPKVVDLRATLPRILGDLLRVQELPNVPLSELCGNRQTVIHPGDSLQGADRFVGLEHIESHTGQSTGGRPIGTESGRKLLFEPGNVTYGYLRPYLNKAWVADITGLCSVEQFVLVPGNGVDPNLLSVVLRSDIVLQAAKEATNSLQLPRLSLRVLLGIEVPDIRRLDNAPEVLRETSSLTRSVIRLAELTSKRRQLAESLLPAARNEIFNAMR